jgi:uncharacterized protein YfbU (UPF0304 family)
MDVRSLFIALKHTRDPFEKNEIRKELLQRLTNLSEKEAKYVLTIMENYIDIQEAYAQKKEELQQVKEVVKQLNKILNI